MALSFGEARFKMQYGMDFPNPTEATSTLYVDRRFTGAANATFTASGITSPNAEYSTQLANAAIGDMHNPFPCPFSAVRAAQAAIASGRIKNALIVVAPHLSYTIGSVNPAQNGNLTGTPAAGVVADICVSAEEATTGPVFLFSDKVVMSFGEGTTLNYICSSFLIPMVKDLSRDETTAASLSASVLGRGVFIYHFGLMAGSFNAFVIDVSNPKAKIAFQGKGFYTVRGSHVINNCGMRRLDFDFEEVNVAEANFVTLSNGPAVPSGEPLDMYVKVKRFVQGWRRGKYGDCQRETATSNAVGLYRDYGAFGLPPTFFNRQLNLFFEVDDWFSDCDDYHFSMLFPYLIANYNLNFKFSKFVQRNTRSATWSEFIFGFYQDGAQGNPYATPVVGGQYTENIRVDMQIDFMDITMPLCLNGFHLAGKNNFCNLRVGYGVQSGFQTGRDGMIPVGSRFAATETSQFVCNGYFESQVGMVLAYVHLAGKTGIKNIFSGIYKTKKAGWPVMNSHASNPNIMFRNALLINDGTVPVVSGAGPLAMVGTSSNAAIPAEVTQEIGTVNVSSALLNYF